jgi:hypothetical protein
MIGDSQRRKKRSRGFRSLVGLLTRAGVELSVTELREVLWLADLLPEGVPVGKTRTRTKPKRDYRLRRTPADARKLDHSTEESESDSNKGTRWIPDVEQESSRYFSPTGREHGHGATAVPLPGVRALPNASILTRSYPYEFEPQHQGHGIVAPWTVNHDPVVCTVLRTLHAKW